MAQYKNKTLKMMYNDQLEYIDCPRNANYEECIETAIERFEIPPKFKKSIKITNESDELFEKCTFELYNLLFPCPAIIFFIKIDNEGRNQKSEEEERKPLAKLSNKRKRRRDENLGVPITRQNCFLGSLPEEPSSKYLGVPVTRQNCFLGSLPEVLSSKIFGVPVTRQNCFLGLLPEEPSTKKYKSSFNKTKNLGALGKIISRRSIRI